MLALNNTTEIELYCSPGRTNSNAACTKETQSHGYLNSTHANISYIDKTSLISFTTIAKATQLKFRNSKRSRLQSDIPNHDREYFLEMI